MSGSFPSSCHVVLKCAAELTAVCRRLSFPFFFLVRRAFLSRSKMSLSIELLIHFLVTFSPGMRRESRREEPRWRGFDRGRAGLTMYGAFWLRWQVWNAALAVGNRSAYSARNTCGSPPRRVSAPWRLFNSSRSQFVGQIHAQVPLCKLSFRLTSSYK